MSSVWLCPACSALHHDGAPVCLRCAAPRPSAPSNEVVPRCPETEPVLLHLPPSDFPYSRTPNISRQAQKWVAPTVMVACAIVLAAGWDPFVRRYAAARALGGESPVAEQARRTELGSASAGLGELITEREASLDAPAPDWNDRVRQLGRRYNLDGDAGSDALGPLEVGVRSAWLELVSLPPDGVPEIEGRIQTAKEELSLVTEELSHAR